MTADGADAADGHRARGSSEAVDSLVDWEFAARTAARLVRPGPTVSRDEAHTAVEQLRAFATEATAHVSATTGLHAPAGEGVLVVDRAGWATANVDAFRTLLAPAVARAAERRDRQPNAVAAAIGSRVTGAEVGSLLAFLASRVLGQYDVFGEADTAADGTVAGRLLLVAPNVLQAEREMDVDARDFRMWVCLHEETHRAQFMANPWLRGHMVERSRALVEDLLGEPGAVVDRLTAALRHLPDLVRSGEAAGTGLIELVQTPEQRRALAELTAVMSLLEGHADVVMDDVGPQVVPSVAEIRRKFTRRRAGRGALDQLLRRLLGLEAKMRQYADGAVFVRTVVDKVGMESFNAVWTSAETLPAPEEIADPGAWVRRVHG
ncbi:MAG TPA: zinc-dependent metalloprotease [Actinomycetales bacterium]|nr:zinc-dependent metalloprotease [Actinomycetales bacterium]